MARERKPGHQSARSHYRRSVISKKRNHEEIRAWLEELMSSMPLEQQKQTVTSLLDHAGAAAMPAALARPERRGPRREEPVVLTIRADIEQARPPIWRRLEMPSDLTFQQLHHILQAVFDWEDRHLWRFGLGGSPFSPEAQLLLCPYDVEDGEEDGVPAKDVHLDEAFAAVGDTVRYVYDYGDMWEVRLKLEKIRPAEREDRQVRAIAGRRAAPPEDCGGLTDAEDLATVLPDPAHLDLEVLNDLLWAEGDARAEPDFHPAYTQLLERTTGHPVHHRLKMPGLDLMVAPEPPEEDELIAALDPILWFMREADGEGITLTAAGHLPPALVERACEVVPTQITGLGKDNREVHAASVRHFRHALQTVKLLRKHKGTLRLPAKIAPLLEDPWGLWEHLRSTLIPERDGFERDASTVLLLHVSMLPSGGALSIDAVVRLLGELGWSTSDRWGLHALIRELPACSILRNLRPDAASRRDERLSDVAITLARATLAPEETDDW